jgi:hypothetical protein
MRNEILLLASMLIFQIKQQLARLNFRLPGNSMPIRLNTNTDELSTINQRKPLYQVP